MVVMMVVVMMVMVMMMIFRSVGTCWLIALGRMRPSP